MRMHLELEDVRTFAGAHRIPLAPITLLVGENSTGKTTLLSMIAAVLAPGFPSGPTFQIPPFDLGSFDTIATNRGGRWRAQSFKMGYSDETTSLTVKAEFTSKQGRPTLANFTTSRKGSTLSLRAADGTYHIDIKPANHRQRSLSIQMPPDKQLGHIASDFITAIQSKLVSELVSTDGNLLIDYYSAFTDLMAPGKAAQAPVSIAPIRTKPRRTYDEVNELFTPEGDHIPLVLSRVWSDPDTAHKEELHQALIEFGLESGLFTDINVKTLGKRPSAPFQISLKIGGPSVNLPDVGYGVSQSLPVVVESILSAKRRRLIVQQPEVHLHPRAQAALGTFFARLARSAKKEFFIETHSDYLVDRVRQEVAKGTLAATDVLILFFHRTNIETQVSPLSLDSAGNVVNPPPEYRRFFMDEELRLLQRTLSSSNQ